MSIFGGLKVAIGLSIVGAVIGEYIAAEGGLGYRQLTANIQFDSALNFAALMVIAGCGMITFAVVESIERLVIGADNRCLKSMQATAVSNAISTEPRAE